MRTARLMTNSTVNLWGPPAVRDHIDPEHPHYITMGGFGMFVDDAAINDLALVLIQRMYDTDTKPTREMLDTLSHLTYVMADRQTFADVIADEAYDQYLDDAVTGV